jgi:hypothetical protein
VFTLYQSLGTEYRQHEQVIKCKRHTDFCSMHGIVLDSFALVRGTVYDVLISGLSLHGVTSARIKTLGFITVEWDWHGFQGYNSM